ncbi:AMP-binding protein [Streptomyces meridianus]|uniref:AMP-binding protein n=1 Tax=Streptomyces meridianus TaxID=2938945 RepID=A0ABT0X7R6_9ACTN|nr:AMP-binding protein [Streptomyces meridianus]MCM2578577.1 AMP-binding protein [Streptomyces meridianus]
MPTNRVCASVSRRAQESPESTALWFGEERITYRQLHVRTTELSQEIDRLLPDRDRPVCVTVHKTPDAVALLLALFGAGRQVLLPSAGLGEQVVQELARRAGCSQILFLAPGDGSTAAARSVVPGRTPTAEPPGPENSLLFLTTSGSTGIPKIVPILRAAQDRFTDWAADAFDIAPGRTVLSYAPLNFDLSLLDVWTTLAVGGSVALVPADRSTDAGYLLDLIERTRVHLVQSVPMLFRLLTEASVSRGDRLPVRLEHAVITGDSTMADLLVRIRRGLPGARLYNLYGCTETNDSLLHRITDADVASAAAGMADAAVWKGLPLGRPLPGVRTVLVDEYGRDLEGPGTGELLVSTPFQTSGYLDPGLTADRFVPRAGAPAPFYRTGDVVTRAADGTLTLEGRNDFQVKVRGVRTNLQEVERVLARHPEVREAVVVAIPDTEAGVRLHALVERPRDSRLNSLDLRRHLSERLPRTSIPSSFTITDEPFPRTSTGKPDRKLIANLRHVKG